MRIVERMSRMISFRISEEEYQQLEETCRATRARSISALARTAVHFWLENGAGGSGNDLDQKVMALERQVTELTAQVEKLARPGSAG